MSSRHKTFRVNGQSCEHAFVILTKVDQKLDQWARNVKIPGTTRFIALCATRSILVVKT